jgi:hypothetical protein
MNLDLKKHYKVLALSIILDLIGLIPFIDIVWAPLAGYLMTRLYKGKTGRIAGIFAFVEEIIPFTDFIPTFTIMWFYTYVFSTKKENGQIIEIEAE